MLYRCTYLLQFLQLSGPAQSVLGAHRNNRPQRLPTPYALMNRSSSPSLVSHIRSAMSDSSSITGSSVPSQQRDYASETTPDSPLPLRRAISAHGIERQIHPSTRRSGVRSKSLPLSLEDKANRDQAGIILISRLCVHDCWPKDNAQRKRDVEECLLQANTIASRENKATTLSVKPMLTRVRRNHLLHSLTLNLNDPRFLLSRRPGEGVVAR